MKPVEKRWPFGLWAPWRITCTRRLIGWLIDWWLVGWLMVGWLVGWLIGWLVGWLIVFNHFTLFSTRTRPQTIANRPFKATGFDIYFYYYRWRPFIYFSCLAAYFIMWSGNVFCQKAKLSPWFSRPGQSNSLHVLNNFPLPNKHN